ncbi:MAG: hypothetical protein LBO69_03480 [Ignavibacteria bacterium]|nr:hypothetical protein [Ignavibacteria bacterium]
MRHLKNDLLSIIAIATLLFIVSASNLFTAEGGSIVVKVEQYKDLCCMEL